jgi:Mor family transcriptional regulator
MTVRNVKRNREIASDYAAGMTWRDLAEKYGLSRSTVRNILNREQVDPRSEVWRKRYGGRKGVDR